MTLQTTPAPPPAVRQPVVPTIEPPPVQRPRTEVTLRRVGGMPGTQVLAAVSDGIKSQIWESEDPQAPDGDSAVSGLQSDDDGVPGPPPIGMKDDDSSDDDGDGDEHGGRRGERHATKQGAKHGGSPARESSAGRAKARAPAGPKEDCWDNPGDGAEGVGRIGGVAATAAMPDLDEVEGIAAASRERVDRVPALQATAGAPRPAPKILRIIGWGLAAAVVTVIIGVIASTFQTDDSPADGGDSSRQADQRQR